VHSGARKWYYRRCGLAARISGVIGVVFAKRSGARPAHRSSDGQSQPARLEPKILIARTHPRSAAALACFVSRSNVIVRAQPNRSDRRADSVERRVLMSSASRCIAPHCRFFFMRAVEKVSKRHFTARTHA
jgi:hypothetical protein